ncbi:MAG: S9 family peptidase [Myxococcota bacterium]
MAFSVQDLVAMRRVQAVAAAPDGSWHAVEVHTVDAETGRYHPAIWRVDEDGMATPLLEGQCAYKQPAFRRDGTLGFVTNRPTDARAEEPEEAPGDDARNQLWLRDDAGALHPLTDEPLGVQAFAFPEAGDGIVVMAPVLLGVPFEKQREIDDDRKKRGPSIRSYTEGPVRHWDHWVPKAAPHLVAYDAEGQNRRDLTPEADREHRQSDWTVSPDGRLVVVTSSRKNRFGLNDLKLLAIDVATGEGRVLFDEPEQVATAPCFTKDGARLVFSQQTWAEGVCPQERLFIMGVDGTERTEIAPDWDRWGHPVGWLADGRLLVTADDDAQHPMFAIDLSTHTVEALPMPEGRGHLGSVVPSGTGFAGIAHGLQAPPEAFRLDADGTVSMLTSLAGPTTPFTALADVENHTVAGAAGDPVQYWLLVPKGATGPCPTFIWIHGGPIGAWNDQWHWRWNANVVLAQGYAVVLPNPRGSTGFGQAFVDGIWDNQWGAACYDDLTAVVDRVAADPRVDQDRMIAMGGSFGGYMTNEIGGRTDRFACLVTHASLYDLPMFAGTTDHPSFWRFQNGADRWTDLDAVNRYSPHRNVTNWKTPTLILHGERDYRVPISEALALFDALQHHGVPSELVVFPDENHWILRPRNIEAWYDKVLEFVAKTLG